jgi:hypothetical protein
LEKLFGPALIIGEVSLALINIEREQQIFDFGIRAFSSRKLTHGGEEIPENKGRSTQRL